MQNKNQSVQSGLEPVLSDHIRANFDLTHGVTVLVPEDTYVPPTLVEVPVSIERYEPRNKALGQMAAIGTKNVAPEPFDDTKGTYTNTQRGAVATQYLNLSEGEKHFGSGALLGPIARKLNLQFEKRKGERGKKEVGALMPLDAAAVNNSFNTLGITDRKAIDWQKDFSAEILVGALAKGELLFAEKGPAAVHDRTAHLTGYALLAPTVWAQLMKKAQEISSDLQAHQAGLTSEQFVKNDPGALGEYKAVRKAAEDLTRNFDFCTTELSQLLAKEEPDRRQIARQLADILGKPTVNQSGEYAPEEVMKPELDATLEWREELLKRAA